MDPEVSIVVPVWNEAPILDRLYERVTDEMEATGRSFELILVDDGSTDNSWNKLSELQEGDERLRLVRLSRNFGQHGALCAGMDRVRGDHVILLDADLQVDPRYIEPVLQKLEEGNELVHTWRVKRETPLFRRRIPSMLVSLVLRTVTGANVHDFGGGLRGLKAHIARAVKDQGPRRRFLAALLVTLARSIAEVPVEENEEARPSRYNLLSLLGVLFDFVTSFSVRPFHLISLAGISTVALSAVAGTLYLALRILGVISSLAYAQVIIVLTFFAALQITVLGLVGEYSVRTYDLLQGVPLYEVAEERDDLGTSGSSARPPVAEVRNSISA